MSCLKILFLSTWQPTIDCPRFSDRHQAGRASVAAGVSPDPTTRAESHGVTRVYAFQRFEPAPREVPPLVSLAFGGRHLPRLYPLPLSLGTQGDDVLALVVACSPRTVILDLRNSLKH